MPKDAAGLKAAVSELYPQKHSRNKLGCAADLLFAAATSQPKDAELNLQALLVTAEYIDHINTLWDFDLYGIRVPEWTARLAHANAQGKQLAQRLAKIAPDNATALAARAYFDLVWTLKSADAKTALVASRDALGLLERAVAQDPATLGGNALLMLGRLRYDLPEFAGGDTDKGIATLEQAYQVAPTNISVLRYLGYVYQQERKPDLAKKMLARMLAVNAAPTDLQLEADELRNARDLAARMPDAELQGKLDAKRSALLKAHPELLTRAATAANMHGGVDPITGKEY
jgi:tetratricopeptide (TPR) repeat protein